ncbi:S-adenosyl-L-methionine-dependent methyltransferase [Penicillium sp. DV-2018c]|nr:S-adenosyl-L-methionine-dependent methyltransferase [Penicillium sp. DV-2018c]
MHPDLDLADAIEVDTDSALSADDDSLSSDTTSLSSSILSHVYENGRSYHAYQAGAYILPNDEQEQDRLDVLHHVYRLCLRGELCRTPLQNPHKVLDVGTGTGIWAISIADEFPSAEVIGIDLSPIQPTWVPPNVRFIIDDLNQDWSFPAESFDFIHVRGLAGCVDDWPEFLDQCYDHLKPGGRLEIAELEPSCYSDDGSFPEDCYFNKWQTEFHRLSAVQGRDWLPMGSVPALIKDSSFEDVDTNIHMVPVGTWPKDPRMKEIGRYMRAQTVDAALESYTLAMFTRYGDWKPAEVEVLLAQIRAELKSNKLHIYAKWLVVRVRLG